MHADPRGQRADVRRAAERFRTRTDWLDSRHSFSFGPHYDPANTHHGLLVVHNDDVVQPGTGFDATSTAPWRSSPGCSPGSWRTRTPRGARG